MRDLAIWLLANIVIAVAVFAVIVAGALCVAIAKKENEND